ncbi:MAG: hypothetical protein ACYS4W_01630 [Planctomycetota bacterium]
MKQPGEEKEDMQKLAKRLARQIKASQPDDEESIEPLLEEHNDREGPLPD